MPVDSGKLSEFAWYPAAFLVGWYLSRVASFFSRRLYLPSASIGSAG